MLRAIYGFDHLPKTPAPVLNGVMTPFAQYLDSNITTTNPTGLCIDPAGFVAPYVTALTNIAFNLSGLIPANPTKMTFGFRLKVLATYSGAHGLLNVSDTVSPNSAAYYMFVLGAANNPWTQIVGSEVYIEVTYDFIAFSCTMLVDGVAQPITQGNAISAAVKTAILSGNFSVNFGPSNNLGSRYAIRDFYILDVVDGDGMVAPLGAQRMYPIILDQADGAGWTPSAGGTAMDTINAALPAAPYVTSASDKTPLVTSLKATAPAGTRINAVSLALSGISTGDSASVSKIEISQGGSNAPVKFVPVARMFTYGAPIGIYPKAPDGTAWDVAKIDVTTLKLTPDTAV